MKQQNWSLALPELFPYLIPVLFLAPPLFVPCYELGPSQKKNLKMPMESMFCMPWWVKALAFSLYFSLLTGIFGRDGFARDWHHRHSVCSPENCSLIRYDTPLYGSYLASNEPEMSPEQHWKLEVGPLFSLFGVNRQSPFRHR